MREITLDLMCDLDEHELRDRALQMSSAILRIDEVEADKKDATKTFSEQLASLRADLRRLSGVIRAKRERRAVMCFVEYHSPVNGNKRISRSDTGEFVRDEPMSPLELQENLFEPVAALMAPEGSDGNAQGPGDVNGFDAP